MAKIKLEDSSEVLIKETKIKPKKKHRKPLRSLVKSASKIILNRSEKLIENPKEPKEEKETNRRWKWKSLALAAVALVASVFLSKLTVSSCGFWATYENNYNKIVHGDERWCYLKLDPMPAVQRLKEQVVVQEDAISLIGASLDLVNREKIIQIAFLGAIGVGKTMTANIIMETFKWQENVVSMIFDLNFKTNLTGEEALESDYKEVSSRLSPCGFNLVVIDDISNEPAATERITELERRLHRDAKQNLYKVVFIVIFKETNTELELKQKLNNFVVAEFLPFTDEMFTKCIEAHEKRLNVKLSPKDFDELKSIDFINSGCKTLSKKLNLIIKK